MMTRNWERSSLRPGWYISYDGGLGHEEIGPYETQDDAAAVVAKQLQEGIGTVRDVSIWERCEDGTISGERGL